MNARTINYMVVDLIPENMINLLTGKPGSFKSWLMASLAVTTANGEQLFNAYSCERCDRVIYIDEDTPQSLYEQRLEILALGQIPTSIDQRSMTGFRLVDDQAREALCREIKNLTTQGKKVLVLLDCLAKVAVGLNLDRTEDAVKAMNYLTQIRDAGATVVVSHHTSIHRRGKEPMNNTLIKAGSDSVLHVEALPLEDRHIFLVSPDSKRVLLAQQFAVELEGDAEVWAFMQRINQMPAVPTDDEKLLFRLFPDGTTEWTVKGISESTGRDLPDSRIREALSRLVQERCLERVINPHDRSHAAYYQLHPDFAQLVSVYKQYIK